jgi:COMPASS component BRE2
VQTLKKRELADGEHQGPGKKVKKIKEDVSYISPIRYRLPSPKPTDFDPPKAPVLTPASERAGRQLYETTEHVYNRKGFRYTYAIVDPKFPASRYHRASEVEPFESRLDFKDAGSHMLFDAQISALSTEKGFRMARANVGAREGRFYWECKILSGVKADLMDGSGQEGGGHVRVGWARREASLEGPVGFDAYSYGLRDVQGQKVHMSRPKDYANADFCEGDVIGLEITLPSLSLHRKVVDGVYNKAVDVSDDLDPASSGEFHDIIRDRVPIRYKTQLYFEVSALFLLALYWVARQGLHCVLNLANYL